MIRSATATLPVRGVSATAEPVRLTPVDAEGRVPHPVCGHPEYEDRHVPSGPCKRCLREIDRDYLSDQPHPLCGCLKPFWSFRTDGGPCGQCLKDIERDYGLTPDPKINAPTPTVEDFRKWRAALLRETDWVEANPARVAREPADYVEAIRAYRQQLFDGPKTYDGGPMPTLPQRPTQETTQ